MVKVKQGCKSRVKPYTSQIHVRGQGKKKICSVIDVSSDHRDGDRVRVKQGKERSSLTSFYPYTCQVSVHKHA